MIHDSASTPDREVSVSGGSTVEFWERDENVGDWERNLTAITAHDNLFAPNRAIFALRRHIEICKHITFHAKCLLILGPSRMPWKVLRKLSNT